MKRLAKIIRGCDLSALASLRKCYNNEDGPVFHYNNMELICEPTHKSTTQLLHFKLTFPLSDIGINENNSYLELERVMLSHFIYRSVGKELDIGNQSYINVNKNKDSRGDFMWNKLGQ